MTGLLNWSWKVGGNYLDTNLFNTQYCNVEVNAFKYLGCWITSDGKSDRDITTKVAIAKPRFVDLKHINEQTNRSGH